MYQLHRWGAAAFVLAITGCQAVGGIERYEANPLSAGCELPSVVGGSNTGKVRVANLFPSKDTVDVCIRSSGAAYGRPIFLSSGRGSFCGGGLKYADVTRPFAVSSGKLDAKIIAHGQACSSPALAETAMVAGPDFGITLAYMGGSSIPASLVAMPETPASADADQQNRRTRFVNAIPGTSLVFGVSDGQVELPATIGQAVYTNGIDYGHAADSASAGDSFVIDDRGYLDHASLDVALVATQAGTGKALLLVNESGQGAFSLFAIGDPTTPFPIRGLFCRESADPDPVKQTTVCEQSELETFSIDIFNAGLYGAGAKVEEKRAKPVFEALAARGLGKSDLLCVTEVSRHDDLTLPPEQRDWTQEHLIDMATQVSGGYRYWVQGTADQNTPFTDLARQDGTLPEPPTQPACNPSVDMPPTTTIDGAYGCLKTKCSTTNDGTGVTQGGSSCYSVSCSGPLAGLIYGNHEQQVCFNCIIANGLSYMTWDQNRTNCTTEVDQSFAFRGSPTSLMLSKYPLVDQDQYVEQTVMFRRVALFARMKYAPEADIDVYCIAAPPLPGGLPYTGDYGNGAPASGTEGWQQNQIWGVQNLVAWIKRKSAGRYAIIAGDWSASANAVDAKGNVVLGPDGMPVVGNVNAASIQLLRDAFVEAVPIDNYHPQCTRCPAPQNPLNKGAPDSQLNLNVFIKDPWAADATTATSLFMDDASAVRLDSAQYGALGPYSETFGYSVQIRRP